VANGEAPPSSHVVRTTPSLDEGAVGNFFGPSRHLRSPELGYPIFCNVLGGVVHFKPIFVACILACIHVLALPAVQSQTAQNEGQILMAGENLIELSLQNGLLVTIFEVKPS